MELMNLCLQLHELLNEQVPDDDDDRTGQDTPRCSREEKQTRFRYHLGEATRHFLSAVACLNELAEHSHS